MVGNGLSNITMLVTTADHEYVVRRRPHGNVPPRAHDMSREYRVLRALADSDVPVPTVIDYSDDESIVGAPFYVMGKVTGTVYDSIDVARTLSPDQAKACSLDLVDVLVRIHTVEVDRVGLQDYGHPADFVRRRIRRWLDQYLASQHRDLPLVETLAAQLAEVAPTQQEGPLVHGDYRLGNVMFGAGDRPSITAVLDWELSTLGDPLTDVAHLLQYWAPTNGRVINEIQHIAQLPGFLSATEMTNAYAERSGRDLTDLDFYLAFENWRTAIILEAIYSRHLRGEATASNLEELELRVPDHLEEARAILASSTIAAGRGSR